MYKKTAQAALSSVLEAERAAASSAAAAAAARDASLSAALARAEAAIISARCAEDTATRIAVDSRLRCSGSQQHRDVARKPDSGKTSSSAQA